jgi:hypothetical protein
MPTAGVSMWVPACTCRYFMGTCMYLLIFFYLGGSEIFAVLEVLGLKFMILTFCIDMNGCSRLRSDRWCGRLFVSATMIFIAPVLHLL